MSLRPGIFMDKDGTLIKDVPYNVDPRLISVEAEVAEGLSLLHGTNYALAIISNQSGIAKNYFKEPALIPVKQKMEEVFAQSGLRLDGFYYCPHSPDSLEICSCRKPMPGLLRLAAAELRIDLGRSWMIGDILNDVEAGNRAGCRSILVNNGNETEWIPGSHRTPDYTAANFKEAIEYIIANQHITTT